MKGSSQLGKFSRSSSSSSLSSPSVVGVTVGVGPPPSCACVSTENAQRPNNVTATMIAAHTANSTMDLFITYTPNCS